ncbi:MAG TPA: TetR/AcrR family transcriptional regulator [Hyphomonadaceae bacterium]
MLPELSRTDPASLADAPDRDAAETGGRSVDRFERRRSDIIAAAIPVLNRQGFKGMRLTHVAELIGLRATGVTYYFPRKEELAVACLECGFSIFHELLDAAEREPDARSRVARLIDLFVQRDAAIRQGLAAPLASFSAIRSLDGEHFERATEGYKAMFRRVRSLFDSPELAGVDRSSRTIRTMILLEQLYWASIWLGDYDLDDFPRIAQRMTSMVADGLAPGASPEAGDLDLSLLSSGIEAAKENFLLAATQQINTYGCRGASVDRIAGSLNLTKGAFYHHNDAKDDLVAACFRRSFGIMRQAQRLVRGQGSSELWRLLTCVDALIRFQLGAEGPLLRTAVLSSMPPEHQVEIMNLSYKTSRQFGAMIADAIADGSARAVDPTIGGAMLHAAVNVASDIRIVERPNLQVVDKFVRPLFSGLLNP